MSFQRRVWYENKGDKKEPPVHLFGGSILLQFQLSEQVTRNPESWDWRRGKENPLSNIGLDILRFKIL